MFQRTGDRLSAPLAKSQPKLSLRPVGESSLDNASVGVAPCVSIRGEATEVEPGERNVAMDIVVRGRHMDVSESFRELVNDKLVRMERFGIDIVRADVEVSRERNPRLADRAIEVEINCHGRGPLIRVESHAGDKYAALDDACNTLNERLRRAADKRRSKRRRHARLVAADSPIPELDIDLGKETESSKPESTALDEVDDAGIVISEGPVLVREKRHATKPMSVLDALDEMELVGHDFFFFHDSDSDRPSVLYRRRGFDYGLIRLDLPADGRAAS